MNTYMTRCTKTGHPVKVIQPKGEPKTQIVDCRRCESD